MVIEQKMAEINVWLNINNGQNIQNFNKRYPKGFSTHTLNMAAADSLIKLRKDLFDKFNIHLIITSSFRDSNDASVKSFLDRYTTNSKQFLQWAKNKPDILAEDISFRQSLDNYINAYRCYRSERYFWHFNH